MRRKTCLDVWARVGIWIGLFAHAAGLLAREGEVRFPYGLGGLPTISRDAIASAAASASRASSSQEPIATAPVAPVGHKRFLSAAGELVLLEVGPWAFDRYVLKEDFAYISWDTIRENFHTGFQYDSDTFKVNQSSHPFHGSLFFGAARSNGYGYWESGAFTLAGSLLWECCMENTAQSINDLVNTTLGGMTRGEVSHRLSTMIRDNTTSGTERIVRETAAAIVDPIGAFTRLVHGDLGRVTSNPDDRFPSNATVSAALGYRRVSVSDGGAPPDQGFTSLSASYGDPFAGEIGHPFDSFSAAIDLNAPGGSGVSRIEEHGILKGWELTEASDPARHIVGFFQEYGYFNNASQVFGSQVLSAAVLSRYAIGSKVTAITDVSLMAVPLAGIQTTNFSSPDTGRNYDYGVGGGPRVGARVSIGDREIAAASYAVVWTHTVNGSSDGNTLQNFRASLRVPIRGPLGFGAGYWWYSRKTTYPGFFEARKTQSEWRVFLDFAYGTRFGRTVPEAVVPQ
jgi:hypothetical protein